MLRFGVFELDETAGELRRNGALVRLPPQPFQVLLLLARNSGEVVDRDRLRREVWGETTVDFDRSLNVCIAQVRTALNDDAESPRFIQTLPRRGYRFLAPIENNEPAPPPPSAGRPHRRLIMTAVCAIVLAIAGLSASRFARPPDRTVRLAVLPFEGAPSPQVDGLFDELLTRLGGIQTDRLRVIGRRSVMALQNTPLRAIGDRLNVGYVVEATVRPGPSGVRVAARLVQTADDAVLWSETFVQDGDPARFEEDVVARVSAAVLAKLFPGATPAEAADSGCRDGWEAYRTGRLLANAGTIAGMEKSLPYFEQAPCATARIALADTLTRLARTGRRDAWDLARKVVPPGADLALANLAFWRDWDWKAAERGFQAALRRQPSNPDVHHDYAWLLVALGRRSEGIASLQRAIALDPLSARVNMDAGWLFLQAGRFREAAAQARRALELDPSMGEARGCLSRALVYAGDNAAALDVMRAESPQRVQAVAGQSPAETVRAVWQNAVREGRIGDPYNRAWRLAWTSSPDEAMDALEEALRVRSSMMPMVAVDPAFENIRQNPRFQKVVRAMAF